MTKLVVFDWNGTLIADTEACFEADNQVLEFFGGKKVDLKTYRSTIIIPAINFYSLHGCSRTELENNYEKLGEVFDKAYERRALRCRTRRGMKEVLHWLNSNSIKKIILSNHTVSGIKSQLVRLKIEKYFDEVVANTDISSAMKVQSKREKLVKYLSHNKIKSSETIIIGDSPEEVEIGKSLQIKSCVITDGYYSTARLKSAGPDNLISNLIELKNIILN
jgi:phosphoglycolate phosphatase-like HAD superfamily hydrolase